MSNDTLNQLKNLIQKLENLEKQESKGSFLKESLEIAEGIKKLRAELGADSKLEDSENKKSHRETTAVTFNEAEGSINVNREKITSVDSKDFLDFVHTAFDMGAVKTLREYNSAAMSFIASRGMNLPIDEAVRRAELFTAEVAIAEQ